MIYSLRFMWRDRQRAKLVSDAATDEDQRAELSRWCMDNNCNARFIHRSRSGVWHLDVWGHYMNYLRRTTTEIDRRQFCALLARLGISKMKKRRKGAGQ